MRRLTLPISLTLCLAIPVLTCSAEVIKRMDAKPVEKETPTTNKQVEKGNLKQTAPVINKDKPKAGGIPIKDEDPIGTKNLKRTN